MSFLLLEGKKIDEMKEELKCVKEDNARLQNIVDQGLYTGKVKLILYKSLNRLVVSTLPSELQSKLHSLSQTFSMVPWVLEITSVATVFLFVIFIQDNIYFTSNNPIQTIKEGNTGRILSEEKVFPELALLIFFSQIYFLE